MEISQVFVPLLKKAASKASGDEFSYDRAAILNISSGAGSIGDNKSGSGDHGSLGYRMSKVRPFPWLFIAFVPFSVSSELFWQVYFCRSGA